MTRLTTPDRVANSPCANHSNGRHRTNGTQRGGCTSNGRDTSHDSARRPDDFAGIRKW
jgi:hypothetical protein